MEMPAATTMDATIIGPAPARSGEAGSGERAGIVERDTTNRHDVDTSGTPRRDAPIA